MHSDPRKSLAAAVRALMQAWYGEENKTRFGRDTGINVAGAQRALNGEGGFGVLEKIAARAKLEPWQLLVPGFDPQHPPRLDAANHVEEERTPYGVQLSEQEQDLIAAFRSVSTEQRAAFHQDVVGAAAMLPGPLRDTLQEMLRKNLMPDGQADPQRVARLGDYPKDAPATVTPIESATPRRAITMKKSARQAPAVKRKKP